MPLRLLLIFALLAFCSDAQFSSENRQYVDSLKSIVKVSKDSNRSAEAYLALSEIYSLVDLDSVVFYAKKAEKIANSSYKNTKNKSQKDTLISILAMANNNIGYVQFNKGDLPNALKSHKKALDLWKQIGNEANQGQALNNLGVIYKQLGENRKALNFFGEALELYKSVGDEKIMANTFNNLGGTYKVMDLDKKALECYAEALNLRRKIGDDRGVATTLNNMGALYKKLGNIDTAYYFFSNSLDLIEKVGDQMGIAHASSNIGEIAFIRNDINLALQMGERSLTIGRSLGALPIIEKASGLLQRVYSKQGRWKEAYEMQQLHFETIAKIGNEEAKKTAMLVEMQYQFEKQKEINLLKNEKEKVLREKQQQIQQVVTYFIAVCFVLVAIFSILLFKRYSIMRKQKEIIEKQNNERKIMLQEIHHRVKNNFQIISSMLKLQSYKDDNPQLQASFQEAINRIHTMATVHEIIYKQEALDEVNAKSYLENLIANLRRTFENKRVDIQVESCEDGLELEQTIPLGIIVNELITNSFKHAFTEEMDHPQIFIQLQKNKSDFVLNYMDNGIGFDPSKFNDSFGLELIKTLAEQLSGQFEIVSDSSWKTHLAIQFSQK